MAIIHPVQNANGAQAVQSALHHLALGSQLPHGIESAPALATSQGHRCYVFSLEQLSRGDDLSAATLAAMRYLLVSNSASLADVEFTEHPGGQLEFASLNLGPMANATLDALTQLEQDTAVRANDYELRLLKIPSMHLVAVWLHHSQREDLVFPIAPTPAAVAAHRRYTESELLAALAPEAQRLLKAFRSDPSGSLAR